MEKTKVLVPTDTHFALKYLYAQEKYKTPLLLHESMPLLDQAKYSSHNISATYYVGHIKSTCRTSYYLTVTETENMSQSCARGKCIYCPVPKFVLVNLCDSDIDTDADGTICFMEKQIFQ